MQWVFILVWCPVQWGWSTWQYYQREADVIAQLDAAEYWLGGKLSRVARGYVLGGSIPPYWLCALDDCLYDYLKMSRPYLLRKIWPPGPVRILEDSSYDWHGRLRVADRRRLLLVSRLRYLEWLEVCCTEDELEIVSSIGSLKGIDIKIVGKLTERGVSCLRSLPKLRVAKLIMLDDTTLSEGILDCFADHPCIEELCVERMRGLKAEKLERLLDAPFLGEFIFSQINDLSEIEIRRLKRLHPYMFLLFTK